MSNRHLVDPELHTLLNKWPAITLDETTLPLLRTPNRIPIGEMPDLGPVEKSEVNCPGPADAPDVPLILYRPAHHDGAALPCIYHMHGGGYVAGAAATLEPIHRMIVAKLGCALVSVDYRLAPETPYPGGLEDCRAGLDWLFAQAPTLGIDPARIGVSGESAGGGLAAALALLVRDRAGPRLAFQHLVYPALDDRTCTAADPHPHTGDFIWSLASNRFAWRAYLGTEPGSAEIAPYAAPARAPDLAGLPSTFVATGALDLFVEEDMAYAGRLIRAGVPTELHVYPGAFHGFDVDQTAQVARRMRRDSWDFLKRYLHPACAGGE